MADPFEEKEGIEINGIPLPTSLRDSPFNAALIWIEGFQEVYQKTNNVGEASDAAYTALKEKYAQDFQTGIWAERTADQIDELPIVYNSLGRRIR